MSGALFQAFKKDLAQCKYEAVIESPFITGRRIESLLPILHKAVKRGVKIVVNTRDPLLHEPPYDCFSIDPTALEIVEDGRRFRLRLEEIN